MKAVHFTLAFFTVLSTGVFAQEAVPSPAPAPAPAPSADPNFRLTLPGVSQPAPANENLGLIPETPEPVTKPKGKAIPEPKPSRKASDSPSRTSAVEDEMAARVRLRQLKTRVLREPKVQELYEKAQTAPTDYEKRENLKAFYTLLYTRIEKLDGSLKKRITTLRNQSIHRLAQTRIDPTDPIDPSERSDRTRREE
jgi:hypothetical protein